MKLYARTPAGTGLGINVLLTGSVKERAGKITSVEIYVPSGCHLVVGYAVEPLPTGRGSQQVLWVDPGDLCANDGGTVDQAAIRAEVERVAEMLRQEMIDGPLGRNWP